jgi:hypothetical protein
MAASTPVFQPAEDRADHGEGHIAGHEHAHERGDEEVDHLGHDLVQLLFQHAHEPDRDDDGDDVALIADEIDVVEAEPGGRGGDRLGRGDAPGVHEVGMDHDHADDRAEILVAAEDLGGAHGDQDGQEDEGRVAEQVDDGVGAAGGDGGEGVGQALEKAHEKAARHDGRDDGHEHVAQRLDGPLVPGGLAGGGLLDLLLGRGLDAGGLDEFVVDLVDGAGADDDLQLAGRLEDALDALDVLQTLLRALAVVRDDEAQSRRAVGRAHEIFFSSEFREDLLGARFVVHDVSPLCSLLTVVKLSFAFCTHHRGFHQKNPFAE